jgi:hypothetical protein
MAMLATTTVSRTIEKIRAYKSKIERAAVFVHAAKAGGTTFTKAVDSASDWYVLNIVNLESEDYKLWPPAEDIDRMGVLISIGHSSYDKAILLKELLRQEGLNLEGFYMTYRPIRDRILSAFSDYWTQVDLAKAHSESVGQEARQRHLDHYLTDSAYYEDEEGNVAIVPWFEAFRSHGSGIPFFYRDIFCNSAAIFDIATSIDNLRVVEFSDMNRHLRALIGSEYHRTHRVSNDSARLLRDAAQDVASEIIEEMVLSDREYEERIREYKSRLPASSAA